MNESYLYFTLHFLSPHFKKVGRSFSYLGDVKTTSFSGTPLCEPELIDGMKQETGQGKSSFDGAKKWKQKEIQRISLQIWNNIDF